MYRTMRSGENCIEACNHIKLELDNQPATLEVLGMIVTRIDRASAVRSGMELAMGLIVMTVRLGGMADMAGVATGDIICEVNGCPVTDLFELKKLLMELNPQEPIRMLFRRVGAWRYLAFPCEESL